MLAVVTEVMDGYNDRSCFDHLKDEAATSAGQKLF